VAVTKEQVNQLYGQLLGRSGQDQYLEGWVNSGMTLDQIRAGIAGSPEGVAYANRPAEPPPPPPPPPEPVATISRAEVALQRGLRMLTGLPSHHRPLRPLRPLLSRLPPSAERRLTPYTKMFLAETHKTLALNTG